MKISFAKRLSWATHRAWKYGLIAFAVAACSIGAQAQTSSVNINITGEIKWGTCDFTIANIDLQTYPISTFKGVGTATGWKPTSVVRTNCDPALTRVNMQFTGTPDSTNPAYFAAISNDGLSGVAIELGDINQASLAPNATSFWNLNGGTTYALYAQFVQTLGAVTSGQTNTPITVLFTYE